MIEPVPPQDLTTVQRAMQGARTALPIRAAARKFGVSHSMVQNAKFVLHRAHPDVIQAVDDGRLSLKTAMRLAKSVMVYAQQDVLARVLIDHPSPRPGPVHASKLARALGVVHKEKKLPRFSDDKQMTTTIESMRVCLTVLERVAGHPLADAERARAWAKDLRDIRTTISQTIKLLEGDSAHGQ